ncbi:hypothetical protein GQ53DRAFT_635717 [Thozetella sp. PMI_491]|nr:hypothetical protein GQ53DRAFT_635717 [Thozetella sp. PMI_491]
MLHFSNVLGPSWLVVLFTMENMYANFKPSPAFQRGIQGGRIAIRFMPPDTNLKKWKQVSRFLTRPWLWEQVRAASRVLMFQTDSIICSNSKHSMDDFLEWDFIGAPVNPFLGQGFNGGLSLRNPKMILDILASPDNDFEEMWKANKTGQYLEDQFYYNKMLARGDAKLPSQDIAQQFSVETVWSEWPLGYHAPRLWNADRMEEIWAYCPEVEMTSREKKVLFVDLTEDD